jgi:hypothetical protein
MPQNYDIIEIISSDQTGGCNCTSADFSNDFIAKTNGTYITSLRSSDNNSIWTPSSLTIGSFGVSSLQSIVVSSNSNTNSKITIRSTSDNTEIYPDKILSNRFQAGTTDIKDNGSIINDLTFNGDILPGANNLHNIGSTSERVKKIWSVDADLSGTLSIANLSPTTLSVTTTSVFTGLATFNGDIEVPGTSTLGDILSTNIVAQTGSFSSSISSALGSFTTANVTNTPTISTSVVRKSDVDLTPNQSLNIYKLSTNDDGFIDSIATATAADLPTHVSRHHTTTRTSSSPNVGNDGLHSYEIGAVERANPVVSKPLRMTTSSNHTYGTAVPYFVVIEVNEAPADSGPEGQIIFRKAQQ